MSALAFENINQTSTLTIDEEIVHATDIGLSLSTNRTNAVRFTTETFLSIVTERKNEMREGKSQLSIFAIPKASPTQSELTHIDLRCN